MTTRPEPSYPAPAGYRWEAVSDIGGLPWIVPPCGAGRCRYVVGPKNRACGRPPVATLMRGRTKRAYDYCERHLYGRWIEGGKVMEWRLVQEEQT